MDKAHHLKLVAAWWDGELEWLHPDGRWLSTDGVPFPQESTACYRIRPKPTLRPWKPEEVPPLALYWEEAFGLAEDGQKLWAVIVELRTKGFCHSGDNVGAIGYDAALKNGLYSTDGGKTWNPCGALGESP